MNLNEDQDEYKLGILHSEVTVTDSNLPVEVNDIIAYSEQTGGQISGTINNPSGHFKIGEFVVLAFEEGTVIDPNTKHIVQPVSKTTFEVAGPFAITKLPPGPNYDVYLCVETKNPNGIRSLAVRDCVFNVPIGTSGINLNYISEGGSVTGNVTNMYGQVILGTCILLNDLATGDFAGVADVNENGDYVTYNVTAGTYTATAIHSKYLNVSTTVDVFDGITANVSNIIMSFVGDKEGPDLNGDGIVNMLDFAELGVWWLQFGLLEADFNQNSYVDYTDLVRITENWLLEAIWIHY
jgi:hypothetical protein